MCTFNRQWLQGAGSNCTSSGRKEKDFTYKGALWVSKTDGHWHHPLGHKCGENLFWNVPDFEITFQLASSPVGNSGLCRNPWKLCPGISKGGFHPCSLPPAPGKQHVTMPGVLNQSSTPNQHREESNPKTDPWSTTKEWLSLMLARLETSIGSPRKTPQVTHIETLHNLLLVMQYSKTTCAGDTGSRWQLEFFHSRHHDFLGWGDVGWIENSPVIYIRN